MTPKEKARNLTDTMSKKVWDERGIKLGIDELKVCALIAVDELIELACHTNGYYGWVDYYEEVKQEIESL